MRPEVGSRKSEVGSRRSEFGLRSESVVSNDQFMMKTVLDIEIFRLSYSYAMDIFNVSRNFPKEERYSLIDQMVRSSRSIAANIGEGWGKRVYENDFKRHLQYALGSLEETKVWLSFAKDCFYLKVEEYDDLCRKYDELGAKIYKLYVNWKTY